MAVNVAQLKGVVSKLGTQLKYDKRAPFVLRKVLSSLALIDAGTWDARLCKRSVKLPSMWWVSICLVMCFKQIYVDCVDFFMRVLYCCSGCTIVIYSVRRQMFVGWTSVSSSKPKETLNMRFTLSSLSILSNDSTSIIRIKKRLRPESVWIMYDHLWINLWAIWVKLPMIISSSLNDMRNPADFRKQFMEFQGCFGESVAACLPGTLMIGMLMHIVLIQYCW